MTNSIDRTTASNTTSITARNTAINTASKTVQSFIGTIAVIAGNCVVFIASTWYLHDRGQRGFKWVQLVGWLMMTAIAVGATVRLVMVAQAFGEPTTSLSDEQEKIWFFSTIVSLLMLASPLVTALEIYRGEIQVNSIEDVDDSDYSDGYRKKERVSSKAS